MSDHEAQRQAWLEEQHVIASQVIVVEDNVDAAIPLNDRFSLLPSTPIDSDSNAVRNYYVGGVDVSFPPHEQDPAVAVYVVLDRRTLTAVYRDHEYFYVPVPYLSSFLAFRELDPLQRLVAKQQREAPEWTPSVILVDGNGRWHPRGAGIACCLGVRTGLPTIGVAKTLLCQGGLTIDRVRRGLDDAVRAAVEAVAGVEPGPIDSLLMDRRGIRDSPDHVNHGSSRSDPPAPIDRRACLVQLAPYCHGLAVPLACRPSHDDHYQVLAQALIGHGGRWRQDRPKTGTIQPIYISVGHRVSLVEATQLCAELSLTRIPEPVRQADWFGREVLRRAVAQRSGKAVPTVVLP